MKRAVAALVLGSAACAAASPAARAIPPETGAPRRATMDARPESCASCHAAIADEWRGSLHRTAFTDATFQASLALEDPKEHAFCNDCHAPARAGVEAGVDCASCHPGDPHAKIARAPAGVAPSASAARADKPCAGCHEFTFSSGRVELVQKTLSEHAASAFAGVSCAECHMPARAGHRDHRFLAGHAPSSLSPAVHVDARRAGRGVDIAIRVDAGHTFPTGDMFRRARLVVFAEDARGQIVGEAERVFGRLWGHTAMGARTEVADTRIRGAWRDSIDLDVSSPPAPAKIRWQLLYERIVAARGDQVSIASSDAIAEGEL